MNILVAFSLADCWSTTVRTNNMAVKKAELDQETALQLFNNGGTLVFLDVPEGTEFGIDYNSWTVGSRFRGVKMIPPGIHFVYYRLVPSALS